MNIESARVLTETYQQLQVCNSLMNTLVEAKDRYEILKAINLILQQEELPIITSVKDKLRNHLAHHKLVLTKLIEEHGN